MELGGDHAHEISDSGGGTEMELVSVWFRSVEHSACFNVLLPSAGHVVFLVCQT